MSRTLTITEKKKIETVVRKRAKDLKEKLQQQFIDVARAEAQQCSGLTDEQVVMLAEVNRTIKAEDAVKKKVRKAVEAARKRADVKEQAALAERVAAVSALDESLGDGYDLTNRYGWGEFDNEGNRVYDSDGAYTVISTRQRKLRELVNDHTSPYDRYGHRRLRFADVADVPGAPEIQAKLVALDDFIDEQITVSVYLGDNESAKELLESLTEQLDNL